MRIKSIILAVVALALIASPAFAKENSNSASLTTTLKINVNVVKALRIVLATAAAAPNCAVADPGTGADYSMNFGDVNGLGVPDTTSATPCTQVEFDSVATTTPIYYSGYKATVGFTGNTTTSNGTLTVFVSTNFAKAFLQMREADTAANLQNGASAVGLTAGTASTISSTLTNNQTVTRFLGVAVTPNNGTAAAQGADSAILTYTLTAP
jgi:hypothetical protein